MSIKKDEEYYPKPRLFMPTDYIQFKISELESQGDYYKMIKKDSTFFNKQKEIENTIINLSKTNQNYLTDEQYNNIKELAASKGGFLTSELRYHLYKRILCVNQSKYQKYYETIWINKANAGLYAKNEYLYNFFTSNDMRTIDADINRSTINSIFPAEKYSLMNLTMKHNLAMLINTLSSFNSSELRYFQGYHDICQLFMFIYYRSFPQTISICQRFSEFHLKECMLREDKTGQFGFNFGNALELFNIIIKAVSPSVYEDIMNYAGGLATFVFSWIVTLFIHDLKDVSQQMRIMDFLLTSHPIAAYVLTALIMVDEVMVLKGKNSLANLGKSFLNFFSKSEINNNDNELDQAKFFEHFQKMDWKKIDFDKFISECNKKMKEIDFVGLIQCFKEKKYMSYYPIMKQNEYVKELYTIEENRISNPYKWIISQSKFMGCVTAAGALLSYIIYYNKTK